MPDTVKTLIIDLLDWLARKERSYEETMEAWRTSCPRLTVWEDANDCGFVYTQQRNNRTLVIVTAKGLEFLKRSRPGALPHTGKRIAQ